MAKGKWFINVGGHLVVNSSKPLAVVTCDAHAFFGRM